MAEYNTVQVGDRIDDTDLPGDCSGRDDGFLCTRNEGHGGQHVAEALGCRVAHVWNGDGE